MAFQFKARVLLELGAELISSDAVAIYELVKNGLDAGSKKIDVDVKIALQHSAYSQLAEYLTAIEPDEFEPEKFIEVVRSNLDDSADPARSRKFMDDFGEPDDVPSALKNLEDAYIWNNRILVRDYGCGMSSSDLTTLYLTVGTPSRLLEKNAAIATAGSQSSRLHPSAPKQQLPLGEKGIGRLSAMRLGRVVRVKTKLHGEHVWNRLRLDWRAAFLNPNLDADGLKFAPEEEPCSEEEFSKNGTTIIIRDLQSDWSFDKAKKIVENDLAKLADPFKSLVSNKFLRFTYQGKPIELPILDREPLLAADAVCEAKFEYNEEDEPELTVNVNYRRLAKEITEKFAGDHLRSTVREEPGSKTKRKRVLLMDAEIIAHALKRLGPWEMKFFWFNRGKIQREQSDLWIRSIRGFLGQWGGGFLVYRDGYRVYPYGERSDDWLDLDRKALASSAYKLNRAQMVGYLRISSFSNPRLVDQTNREGFRDSYDKEALRRLLRFVILGVCKPFLENVEKAHAPPLAEMVSDVEGKISTSKDAAVAGLLEIRSRVPGESQNVARVMGHLEEVSDAWERAKLRIVSFEEEIQGYIHLAGVGLMLEFIAHELTRVTQDTLRSVAAGRFSPEVVEAQLKTLEKRIRILDELSIPGRQRRERHNLVELLQMLIDFHDGKAERELITVKLEPTSVKSFVEVFERGQFLQIIDNLFSNSFYWLVNRLHQEVPGVISIRLDSRNRKIYFSDNGPGIQPERREEVFNQFVTSKPPREGRGLGLYIARRLAEENGAKLSLDEADADGMHRTFVLSFNNKDA
jgi:hypothetical protein